ncbi:C69 family dipeptidase [Candidatus Sumerlaeota bacterium]|nr:C69 family dipeptidase [Candidatus Sumerlaeota bacterium]
MPILVRKNAFIVERDTLRRLLAIATITFLVAAHHSWACYTVVVGNKASADGSVLVGHNEQNGGRRVLNFRRIPRQHFADGATLRLRRGGELAQVTETNAFFWSENPGLEFSDLYLNEWGVGIVSDGCPTREDDYEALARRGEIRNGGIGYMLRRLVAQRARTAKEGVQIAGQLVERFGYVDSGRTYVIADPNEAWLLSVVRGRRWAAKRVPDDSVVLLPNVHIITELDIKDGDNVLASADIVSYAVKRRWFNPRRDGPFNFRKVYNAKRDGPPDPRRFRGQQIVTEQRMTWPPREPLPFAVKPAHKLTVAAVINILRDHAGPAPLCTPTTQEAAVFQLRSDMPREVGCIYWRTTAEPCLSVLTPWYLGVTETPKCYYRPTDIETQLSLEHHFSPPAGTFDTDLSQAWWKFATLRDIVNTDYKNRIGAVQSAWRTFEEQQFEEQKAVEERVLQSIKTDKDAACAYLTQYCADLALRACEEADRMAKELQEGRRLRK